MPSTSRRPDPGRYDAQPEMAFKAGLAGGRRRSSAKTGSWPCSGNRTFRGLRGRPVPGEWLQAAPDPKRNSRSRPDTANLFYQGRDYGSALAHSLKVVVEFYQLGL